ncbi:MAG TPA: hypothetical protein VGA70_13730 [Longimicrobiales bacterium]
MTTDQNVQAIPELPPELRELVSRTEGLQPWRRVFHALNGVALALLPSVLGLRAPTVVALLAVGLGAMVALDLVRLRSPGVNRAFFRLFTSLASPREARHFASSTWYALGGLLAYALFPFEVVTPAILVLGLADPVASVVGRRWGVRPLGKGSWLGAGAFFITAATILLAATGDPLTLLVALVVTAVEVLPWPVDDNLTIPLCVAILLTLLAT